MRLIDANALREYYKINEHCEKCHWNNRDCSKPPYYSLHDICEAIDEVPTVDAIPVEWLRGLMLSTEDDVDKVEFAWIMREWESEKKEQEAR